MWRRLKTLESAANSSANPILANASRDEKNQHGHNMWFPAHELAEAAVEKVRERFSPPAIEFDLM